MSNIAMQLLFVYVFKYFFTVDDASTVNSNFLND